MTGAVAGISALLDAPPREAANVLFLVHHGLEQPRQQSTLNRYLRTLDAPMSAPAPLIRLLESRRWEAPRHFNGDFESEPGDARELCRSLNVGPAIFSCASPSRIQVGQRAELTRTVGRLPAVYASPATDDTTLPLADRLDLPRASPHRIRRGRAVSPRQQQTLRHLLAGESEKQIAQRLSRSQHTVHTYVKAIYRNYRVSSRGELLSLFVK